MYIEDMDTRGFIYKLHRNKESLTIPDVTRLAESMKAVFPEDDMSFLAWSLRKKAAEMEEAETDQDKLSLAARTLDWLVAGLERDKRHGQIVRYTRRKIGSLTNGKKIGLCPVCGRKGVLLPPTESYPNWHGKTHHAISPFFMGEQMIDWCEWQNSTNHKAQSNHETKTKVMVQMA